MEYNYLYIDDTKDAIERGTINGLEDGNEIRIDFKFPKNWESQINELVSAIPNYSGIIIDLRLNDNPNSEGKFAQYRGSSIAQELRTLAKENLIKNDFPILLISANDNIEKSLDQTSLDLFDYRISKNSIGAEPNGISYLEFRNKLKWLADGYNYLNNSDKTISKILRAPEKLNLDVRFMEQFNKVLDRPVVHVIARFLVKEVMSRPTFLIDEKYVATRLGIDLASQDWQPFLEKCLSESMYTGAFSTYYPKWWMSLVELFWHSQITTELNLRNTSSTQKVELISKQTGFKNLKPIEKGAKSKSDCFWVVCKATHMALDTIDGFTIAGQDNIYPWQELEYISISEALRPTMDFTVSSTEKPRLQRLKELFAENEERSRK
jgi:hypothetical protein